MHRLLFFLFFTIPPQLNQKIDSLGRIEGRDNQILALKCLLDETHDIDEATAMINYKIGFRYDETENLDSAIHYFELALQCFATDNNQAKSAKNIAKLSLNYKKKQQYLKSLQLLDFGKKFVAISDINSYLFSLSEILLSSNNNSLNIDILKFQNLTQKFTNEEYEINVYETLKKLSQLEVLKDNFNSIEHLNEAKIYINNSKSLKSKIYDCDNEMGLRYQTIGNYKMAEFCFNKLQNDEGSLKLYHNNLGKLYTTTKKYNLASWHIRKSHDLLIQHNDADKNSLALNIVGMSILKKEMHQLDSALFYVNKALATYPIDKAGMDNTEFLIDICDRKIYKYEIQQLINKDYFNKNEVNEIDNIIDALRKKQTDEASKADIRTTAIDFYKKATIDCINHSEEKLALYYKEKAKSILLIENYLQLTNEKEILDFKYAVEALLKLPNPDTIDFMKTFEKLKPVLSLLVKKYETNQNVNNEVFYDAIEKCISQNPKDHVYLDFFETEEEMLVFEITNKVKIHRLRLSPQFKVIVSAYKDSILHAGDLHLAPSIYNAIIKPLGQLPHNITIIPDSYLSYLPFEALHSGINQDDADYTTYDFLIKYYNIDYNYSLGMASLMQDKKINSTGTHVFLPSFTYIDQDNAGKNQKLIPLRFAKEEAAVIKDLFNATVFENTSANKQNFIKSLSSANVIHFAGHAILNHENHHLSYLAFDSQDNEDSRLYLKDLIGVSSNADLITLSACQTAAGKYSAGEGLLSLGRTMVACGSKSIVTSLWNIEDGESEDIIKGFYKNLKAGSDKSNALHKSKLDFLRDVRSTKLAHPYYWSAMIFIGDDAPLKHQIKGWMGILMAILAGLIIIVSVKSFQKKK